MRICGARARSVLSCGGSRATRRGRRSGPSPGRLRRRCGHGPGPAMADSRANSWPNTNGSQFLIVTTDAAPWLDGKHTVFGKVTSGQDVAERISTVPTGANDRPLQPVTLDRVELA